MIHDLPALSIASLFADSASTRIPSFALIASTAVFKRKPLQLIAYLDRQQILRYGLVLFGETLMPLIRFDSLAMNLPAVWKSSLVEQVGSARIKVLRMDEQAYGEETHDYNEGLLVISGKLLLEVGSKTVEVQSGQMYLALAGVPHSVLPGSHGTLVIIDT